MAVTTWIVEGVAKHFSNWEASGNNENKTQISENKTQKRIYLLRLE